VAEQHSDHSQKNVIGIASVIWASSIFLSRIMGLVREQIIGRTLGASRTADIYFASFTLPDFLNYLKGQNDDLNVILGARLTVLALINGFSVSMASSRDDQRKALEGRTSSLASRAAKASGAPVRQLGRS